MAVWGKRRGGGKIWRLGRALLVWAVLAAAALLIIEKALAPNIQALAEAAVHNQVNKLMADTISQQVAANGEISSYQQLMDMDRDEQGQIIMLSVNTPLINSFSSRLLSLLEEELSGLAEQQITVPLFAASGSKLMSSLGPELPIKVRGAAVPRISLSDSFIAAGINQTKHSIYLQAEAELMVAVPFSEDRCHVSTTVLLAEGIIIGNIPETYLNFEAYPQP